MQHFTDRREMRDKFASFDRHFIKASIEQREDNEKASQESRRANVCRKLHFLERIQKSLQSYKLIDVLLAVLSRKHVRSQGKS